MRAAELLRLALCSPQSKLHVDLPFAMLIVVWRTSRQQHESNEPACAWRQLLLWLVRLRFNGLWQLQLLEESSEVNSIPAHEAKRTMWVQGPTPQEQQAQLS
jgi:hypothetical protein